MANRKKPCEYCEDWSSWTESGKNGHQLYVEIYPENNIISIASFANDDAGESEEISAVLEMNYCPKCGRKLI